VPVLCTYKARGMVADSAPWCAGVATGATIESPLLAEADLVVGVGLDPVELIPAPWPYTAPVVLLGGWPIDDSTWFAARLAAEIVGDLVESLTTAGQLLSSEWPAHTGAEHRTRAQLEVRAAVPDLPIALVPQDVVSIARELAPPNTIATVDAGAHMLVAMPLWTVDEPCRLLISSGLATMGFALPAAIAAAEVNPDTPVICFTGDGGLSMVLGELETLARRWLHVIVVVFDDSSLSLIAAKQAPSGHGGEQAVRYLRTDYAGLAHSLGVHGIRVDDELTYRRELDDALHRSGPTLIDAVVDPSAYSAVLDAIRGPRRDS
jgi:acetolactate synthase-1/2/3 large subunit